MQGPIWKSIQWLDELGMKAIETVCVPGEQMCGIDHSPDMKRPAPDKGV